MKAKEVLKILKITRPTLTKYVKNGKIKVKELTSQEIISNEYVQPCDPVMRLIIAKARKAVIDHVDERLDAIERKIDVIMKATVPMY